MDALMNSVESLWNAVISMIWKLWICFAVIVFVHVKFGVSPLSNTATEVSQTSVAKTSQLASVRKIIKTAKKLMRRNKLDDAIATLNQGSLLSEEMLENNGSELHEHRFLAGCLHEIRALCLYRKGDVMDSMVEMDRGLALVKSPDSHLLTSANHCFQLFHKWCCENFDHFQQDIVVYFQDKKKRLETGALEKIANTSLLMESIHCLILSDFLVRRAIVEAKESTDLKKLCQNFYCLLNSEEGDDQILSSLNSPREPLDDQKSANEIKYKDLVKQTEEIPILKWGRKVCGSESPVFKQQSENMASPEVEEGPHETENVATESKYLDAMHEAYTRSRAEVEEIEDLQHVPGNSDSLELILDSCGSYSREVMSFYGNPDVEEEEGPPELENMTSESEDDLKCGQPQDAKIEHNVRTGILEDGELETGMSGDNEIENGKCKAEEGDLDKSKDELECDASQGGKTEHSELTDGVKSGSLADGGIETGMLVVGEMKHGICKLEDDELESGKSTDTDKKHEPAAYPESVESMDLVDVNSADESKAQFAEVDLPTETQ